MPESPYVLMDHSLLLKACMEGNRAAQGKLYQLFASRMLGLCMWYAKNKEEAEEILQDGFVQVFRFLGQYSGKGSLESWIRKIMINAALQKYRKKNQLMWIGSLAAVEQRSADGEDVFQKLDGKDLMKMVQKLTPGYRMVFTLFVLEGLKHREIADLLGITEGTSKSNLSDARTLLQKAVLYSKKISIH